MIGCVIAGYGCRGGVGVVVDRGVGCSCDVGVVSTCYVVGDATVLYGIVEGDVVGVSGCGDGGGGVDGDVAAVIVDSGVAIVVVGADVVGDVGVCAVVGRMYVVGVIGVCVGIVVGCGVNVVVDVDNGVGVVVGVYGGSVVDVVVNDVCVDVRAVCGGVDGVGGML